jgi:transposase
LFGSTADVGDRDGARHLVANAYPHLCKVRKVLGDGGYTGEDFAQDILWLIGAQVEVVKRNELHTFAVLPKRWIVERSFAWLDKCRRLWKNCERKLHTSIQMVKLAFIGLLLRRY